MYLSIFYYFKYIFLLDFSQPPTRQVELAPPSRWTHRGIAVYVICLTLLQNSVRQSQDRAQIFLAKLVNLSLYNSTNPSLLVDICCNEKWFGWEMSNSLYPVTGPLSQFLRAKATFDPIGSGQRPKVLWANSTRTFQRYQFKGPGNWLRPSWVAFEHTELCCFHAWGLKIFINRKWHI